MPLVSIISALHNKASYIADTIRSVISQTMEDWEMIVVENGSTDNGPNVVRQFSDARIHLLISQKCGPGAARNLGLAHARGEWVLFLDADDLIVPDYLLERLGRLEQNPAADILVGKWEEFKDSAPQQKNVKKPTAYGGTVFELANAAIAYAPWAVHAALVKKSRITNGRLWPEEMDCLPSEDSAFWFPVVYGASIVWSDKVGALYRVNTENSRNEVIDVQRWIRAVLGVIQHNVNYLESQNRQPNSEQCAQIVRVLEKSYRLGLTRESRATAMLALSQAKDWLRLCSPFSPAIAIRKFLGLRLFNLLRYRVI